MKQYLLLCGEEGKERLEKIFNTTVEFLEVQGMNLNGENQYNLLVTPVNPPLMPACVKEVEGEASV